VGDDVVVGGAGDAEDVDAPVGLEVLVFNGDNGLAQDRGEVVVVDEDAAFEGEGTEGTALDIVELGGGGGAVALEVVDLRQVDRVNKGEAGQGAGDSGEAEENAKSDAAGELAAMTLRRGLRVEARRTESAAGWG
jgi:hypothetical protein